MKTGWTETTLGEVTKITNGGTPKSNVAKYWGGPNAWITPKDMGKMESRYATETLRTITDEGLDNSSAKLVEPQSVILSTRAPIGHLAINTVPMAFNQGCRGITPCENLNYTFLYYFLESSRKELNRRGSGTTFKELSATNLKSLPIPLPPLEEQRRIVAVLDEAFAALDRARENVEANLADATSGVESVIEDLMVSFEAKEYTLAELLDIGWITSHLDGNHGGDYPRKSEFVNSGVPYISANCIVNGEVDFSKSKYLTPARAAKLRKGIAQNNDVLFAHNATVGPVAILSTEEPKVVLSTSLTYYRCNPEKILPQYLAVEMRSAYFCSQYRQVMRQATRNQVPITKQRTFSHLIPSLENQKIIVAKATRAISALETLIISYQSQLTDINDLRQSLLQRAFTGELAQSAIIATNDNQRDERFSTASLVLAFNKHLVEQRQNTFGHVKAQKILHLTESIAGLDLGRQPQVRQAGPHDQEHFGRVEAWAKRKGIFEFKQRRSGGYTFNRGTNYDAFLSEAKTLLTNYQAGLSCFLPLLVDMNTEDVEVFTTVHAAWNNLLADGKTPSDDEIVTAARENWHESKMEIARQKFFNAVTKIRRHDLEPDGSAKYVSGVQESLI